MNWLARLKKIETAPERDATETTKMVSVVFVAPDMAPMQKTARKLNIWHLSKSKPGANFPRNGFSTRG